jgi:prophage regulatory protein
MKKSKISNPADQLADDGSTSQVPAMHTMLAIQPVSVDVLIRLPAVLQIIPVSRAKFYQEIKRGTFPKPQKIGQRIAVWRLSTIKNLAMAIAI